MPHNFDVEPLPGYPPEYGLLLATLQDGTREWQGELGEPDPDTICWQPYENGYSIGSLLIHIAEVEAYWFEVFTLARVLSPDERARYLSGQIDQDNGYWPKPPREPFSYYYKILSEVRTRSLESLREFPPPDTTREKEWGKMTLRWVVAHVVEHDSYHGGQAVMLHEISKRMRG